MASNFTYAIDHTHIHTVGARIAVTIDKKKWCE